MARFRENAFRNQNLYNIVNNLENANRYNYIETDVNLVSIHNTSGSRLLILHISVPSTFDIHALNAYVETRLLIRELKIKYCISITIINRRLMMIIKHYS